VLAATDEVVADGVVSSTTWGECVETLGSADQLVELVMVIGLWRMISTVLRSLDVPLEEGVTAWPPDGHTPD
jgi:alkylhydroperoxidase family enzyme